MNQTALSNDTEAAPVLAALPPPDPLAVLREQLAAITAERDVLAERNKNVTAAHEADMDLLTEAREKLKALEENPLTFALANLDAGQVLMDAGDLLNTLCEKVLRRQEKGRLALNITVKPFKGDALVFVPEVKVTEPKEDPVQAVFYATEDGALSRQDPRQKEFSFRGRREADDFR